MPTSSKPCATGCLPRAGEAIFPYRGKRLSRQWPFPFNAPNHFDASPHARHANGHGIALRFPCPFYSSFLNALWSRLYRSALVRGHSAKGFMMDAPRLRLFAIPLPIRGKQCVLPYWPSSETFCRHSAASSPFCSTFPPNSYDSPFRSISSAVMPLSSAQAARGRAASRETRMRLRYFIWAAPLVPEFHPVCRRHARLPGIVGTERACSSPLRRSSSPSSLHDSHWVDPADSRKS